MPQLVPLTFSLYTTIILSVNTCLLYFNIQYFLLLSTNFCGTLTLLTINHLLLQHASDTDRSSATMKACTHIIYFKHIAACACMSYKRFFTPHNTSAHWQKHSQNRLRRSSLSENKLLNCWPIFCKRKWAKTTAANSQQLKMRTSTWRVCVCVCLPLKWVVC